MFAAAFAIFTSVVAAQTGSPAPGANLRARLIVEGAEPECPGARELGARVNEVLGRQVLTETAEDLRVYWASTRDQTGQLARFRLEGRGDHAVGTRWVRARAEDCGTRLDTWALVLALMLDLPRAQAVTTEVAPRRPWLEGLELEAGGSLTRGWLPAARAGAEIAVRADPRGFLPVAAGFSWWPDSRFALDAGSFAARAMALSLAVSWPALERDWGRVGLAAVGRLGSLAARGLDFPMNAGARALVADLRAELDLTTRLAGPLWARGAFGVATPLRRPTVLLRDGQGREIVAHRSAIAYGIATLSLVVHFVP